MIAMYRLQKRGCNIMKTKSKIRRKCKMIVAAVLMLAVMMGSDLEWNEKRVEGEPDVVSSMIVNNEQYLIVVANRNEIENEEEFKKLLIRRYEENSFHSVKFSRDLIVPEKVYMKVYRWRGDVKKEEPPLRIIYCPCEGLNVWED